jgi:hypothetical protein
VRGPPPEDAFVTILEKLQLGDVLRVKVCKLGVRADGMPEAFNITLNMPALSKRPLLENVTPLTLPVVIL